MCQRLNIGESDNFYFGVFICIRPLIHKLSWYWSQMFQSKFERFFVSYNRVFVW